MTLAFKIGCDYIVLSFGFFFVVFLTSSSNKNEKNITDMMIGFASFLINLISVDFKMIEQMPEKKESYLEQFTWN